MASPVHGSAHKILTIEEVASIMRLSVQAIYAKLHRGTFVPLPISEFPYRWNHVDLDRWARGEFREAAASLRKRAKLRAIKRSA